MGSRAEAPAMKELVIALPLTGDVILATWKVWLGGFAPASRLARNPGYPNQLAYVTRTQPHTTWNVFSQRHRIEMAAKFLGA